MNSATYSKTIANNFGGLQKDELYLKLQRLILMVRREESEKGIETECDDASALESIVFPDEEPDTSILSTMRRFAKKSRDEEESINNFFVHTLSSRVCYAEFKRYDAGSYENSIIMVDESRLSEYDKARALLYFAKRYKGWHPVASIPGDILNQVITLIDIDHCIEYNEACTHFRRVVIIRQQVEE